MLMAKLLQNISVSPLDQAADFFNHGFAYQGLDAGGSEFMLKTGFDYQTDAADN